MRGNGVGGMSVGVTAPIVSFLSLDATSTTRHVVSSDRGWSVLRAGGIAELMVSGVDTSTCCFVAHKISLTCTSRVFLQQCGRLPRGRWTGGTGSWHGPGLQIEFHALVKNQNVTHKRKKKSWRQYQKEFILLSLRVDYKLIRFNYFLSENLPPPSIPHKTVDLRLYLFTWLLAWLPIEIRSPETPPF